MTTTIYWLCDGLAIIGGAMFLTGIYLLWGLAILLMTGGLMLLGYAARLSYRRFCDGTDYSGGNHDS